MQNFVLRASHHSKGGGINQHRHSKDDSDQVNSQDDDNGYVVLDTEHRVESDQKDGANASTPLAFENSNDIWSSLHSFSGQVVHDPKFQKIIVSLIIINSITMGLATFPFIRDSPTWTSHFETMDRIFLWIFTAELLLQFVWNGLALFHDGWLTFDFTVIVLSWAFVEAQVIRAFRVIRALRVITRIQELKDLVEALLSCIPSMAAIGALLLLVFYIFAVMFTQLFHDLHREGYTDLDYFSRLDITFFTLFQLLLLDSWSDITRQCMQRYPWAWIIFISFTIISTFVVVNLIIAVICNAIPQNTGTDGSDKPVLDPLEEIARLHTRIDELCAILKSHQQQQQNNSSPLQREQQGTLRTT